MKVLQVLYSGLGGHGSVVTSLIRADHQHEWKHSLLFYGIEELLPAYREFCTEKNIPFSFVKKQKGSFWSGGPAIRRASRQEQPDAIILHSPTLIIPAWWYCRLRNKKLFVVEHTPHATKGKAEKLASFLSLLMARKVICLSAGYREQLQRQFRFIPVKRKTVVIQNGLDLEKFHPVEKTRTAEMHVGMTGRFSAQKNQALVIDAAIKGFRSGELDRGVHFHFAGTGDQLPALREIVRNNQLEGQIHFHGLLDESSVIALLHRLDVYVHASFAETMCTSMMQAMACGLPVAGSDIPGINDLATEGQPIRLFRNQDASELLQELIRMRNPEYRAARAALSRPAAEKNFSSFRTFRQYADLVKKK